VNKIVECVPNISEGRDTQIIDKVCMALRACEGVTLLDVDPGRDTNRTVITFVGSPEAVEEGAIAVVSTAAKLIDMSKHEGAHPRMGATDVCPFIPISGVTEEECIELSKRVAKRIGEDLGIPAYLYGKSAQRPDREKLPDIRSGEYEALEEKMKDPDFAPDFGVAQFNKQSGATAVGVRGFLLAYNIDLNTTDVKSARDIGLTIREQGRAKRDKNGEIIRDEQGKAIKVPGRLQHCQATGWYIEEYKRAQVTMNLHNHEVTGLHTAFDVVEEEAIKRGLRVTGSELVGLVPLEAILASGKYYLKKMRKSIAVPEAEIIHTAIMSLGLNEIAPFHPQERIIEYAIKSKENDEKKLVDMNLHEFADELSSDSPAPGGGSIAALAGALSAGLSSMVANLSHGHKDYKRVWAKMEEDGVEAQKLKDLFIILIDKDTDAFNAFMAANRLPNKTEEEISYREAQLEAAAQFATQIPMETLENSGKLCALAETMVRKGNVNARSDGAVAAIMAEAAAESAYLNVIINLPTVKDQQFKKSMKEKADAILAQVKKDRKRIALFAHAQLLKALD
jgi:glutamate formiminotransferase/formiminotetrahydrofolate cyclodeaminase